MFVLILTAGVVAISLLILLLLGLQLPKFAALAGLPIGALLLVFLLGVPLLWVFGHLVLAAGTVFLFALPFLLSAAALFSCLSRPLPLNTKLLWVLIVLLAPFLGPLLWFFWGRKHT